MATMRPTLTVEADQKVLQALADLHAMLAIRDLRANPQRPLYRAGVRYRREEMGAEIWQLPSETAKLGYGDCEDLAAWRVAELRLQGEPARIVIRQVKPRLWHVLVKRGNGQIEDPSRKLGMTGAG